MKKILTPLLFVFIYQLTNAQNVGIGTANYKTATWKTCVLRSCSSKWELTVLLNDNPLRTYGIDGIRYNAQTNGLLNTDITVGPDFFDVGVGTNVISFKGRNMLIEPWLGMQATPMIIPR